MKITRGFTLIELLVVVLIIGILAAVALPQYMRTIHKTKITEAIVLVKAIRDAEERYFLENGYYIKDIEELDVAVPTNRMQGKMTTTEMTKNYYYVCNLDYSYCGAYIDNFSMPSLEYRFSRTKIVADEKHVNKLWCVFTTPKNIKARRLCQSMGKVDVDNNDKSTYLIN